MQDLQKEGLSWRKTPALFSETTGPDAHVGVGGGRGQPCGRGGPPHIDPNVCILPVDRLEKDEPLPLPDSSGRITNPYLFLKTSSGQLSNHYLFLKYLFWTNK